MRRRALALLMMTGCFSSSLLQEPKPLAPGKVRGGFGVEMGTKQRRARDTGAPEAMISAGVRVGIAPRVEARGKLSVWGGELGVNVQVLDTKFVDLLLMPSFFDYDVDDILDENVDHTKLVGFALPAILSVSLDEADQFQLFVGPDYRVGTRNGSGWNAIGFHFGAAISGPHDHGTLVPECAFLAGLNGNPGQYSDYVGRFLSSQHSTFSCSLGVTAGATHAPFRKR